MNIVHIKTGMMLNDIQKVGADFKVSYILIIISKNIDYRYVIRTWIPCTPSNFIQEET